MLVDLIKAFDATETRPARNDGARSGSEFPKLLGSALNDGSDRAVEGEGESTRPESATVEAGSESEAAAAYVERDGEPGQDGSEGPPEDGGEEMLEVAVESGSVGATASPLVENTRIPIALEAESALEGRPTVLEQQDPAGRPAGQGKLGEAEARGAEAATPVPEEIVRGLAEMDRGEGVPVENTKAASAEAGLENAVLRDATPLAGAPNEPVRGNVSELRAVEGPGSIDAADPAQATAAVSEEQRDSTDPDSSRRDGENRSAEQLQLDRAAEASQLAAVDANLRQAASSSEAAQRAPEVVAIEGASAVANPVAGGMTEVTTTATPGTPTPAAASDAISVQTEWLATRGGGTARLVLHPQELGEISIRVTLRDGAVDVVMVAQEAMARGLAEEQSERLGQAFASRDLRMENFEVRRGSAADLPSGDGERFAESGAGRDGPAGDRGGSRSRSGRSAVETSGANDVLARSSNMPRIMTAAPEAGVDLRI